MEFEWDPAKADSNFRKHGITFAEASLAFDDPRSLEFVDNSGWPDEERWRLIATQNGTVLVVIYTERPPVTRIISARKGNRHEQRLYQSQNN